MKLLAFILSFCLSFNVLAASGTVQALEKHLDDYHYALSVEWDQKDQSFYQAKTKEFFTNLEKLIKEEGLSSEEMISLAEKKMNNKEAVEALKLRFSLLNKNASVEELTKIIKESTSDLYSQGASWNGSVILTTSIVLIIAAAVGYAIWWDKNHVCVAYEEQYVCNSYNNCHYDPYYGGYYCHTPGYTVCGWTDVCTKYERK